MRGLTFQKLSDFGNSLLGPQRNERVNMVFHGINAIEVYFLLPSILLDVRENLFSHSPCHDRCTILG